MWEGKGECGSGKRDAGAPGAGAVLLHAFFRVDLCRSLARFLGEATRRHVTVRPIEFRLVERVLWAGWFGERVASDDGGFLKRRIP